MKLINKFLSFIACALCASCTFAAPYYGARFSLPLIDKEPLSLKGYQYMLLYDPDCLKWRGFDLYFDVGFSHFWITNHHPNKSLWIISAAPVIRYMINLRQEYIRPFIEFSIGLSYLSRTRIDKRNLGIHFAFQDRIGAGVILGTKQQFVLGLHAVHYSNAHLSSNNSGITIPLVLDLGYRFN